MVALLTPLRFGNPVDRAMRRSFFCISTIAAFTTASRRSSLRGRRALDLGSFPQFPTRPVSYPSLVKVITRGGLQGKCFCFHMSLDTTQIPRPLIMRALLLAPLRRQIMAAMQSFGAPG